MRPILFLLFALSTLTSNIATAAENWTIEQTQDWLNTRLYEHIAQLTPFYNSTSSMFSSANGMITITETIRHGKAGPDKQRTIVLKFDASDIETVKFNHTEKYTPSPDKETYRGNPTHALSCSIVCSNDRSCISDTDFPKGWATKNISLYSVPKESAEKICKGIGYLISSIAKQQAPPF